MNKKSLKVLEYNKLKEQLKEYMVSKLSQELVDELEPLDNLETINHAQAETREAYLMLMRKGTPPLFGIYDMSNEYSRAKKGGVLTPGQILRIGDGLRVSNELKKYFKSDRDDEDEPFPIMDGFDESLTVFPRQEKRIEEAIISPEEISDDASTALRSIRRRKVQKKDSIQQQLNKLVNSQTYKKYLQDSLITLREGRYVVPVKAEHKRVIDGLVHDMSASGATVFIEPMSVVNLNNELKQLDLEEEQEIQRILSELTDMVANIADYLMENQRILQRLDFAFGKAKMAVDMKATQPILTEHEAVNLKQARHPLLEVEEVVPVDIKLGNSFTTLIITGPNTGGKTVALKTMGLLTLMAQSGLHIPASEESTVRIFREVYADIGDEQSIEQSLSTFSSHMVNIVEIMEKVTVDDLVLFDELGAGTDPTEGAALAMAILESLRKREIYTMATTHYSQLKIYALSTPGVTNGSVEFDVKTLSPTYRLMIGLPGKSNAFEISRRLGLNEQLITSAKKFVEQENIEFEDALMAIDADRKEIEEKLDEIKSHEMEIDALKIALKTERAKLAEQKEKIIQDARDEAFEIMKETREESQLILSEFKDITSSLDKDHARRLQQAQEVLKKASDERQRERSRELFQSDENVDAPNTLKKGQTVEVAGLGHKGTVLTEPDPQDKVMVQVGAMKMELPIDRLILLEDEEKQQAQASNKRMMDMKSQHVKPNIDVRGYNIEEAKREIDKYLDDAYLSGLKEVQIIHGKGTGALRQGLQDFLKRHKHSSDTRAGGYHEGGTGVTVVELKS